MEFECAKHNKMYPSTQVVSWDERKGTVDTNHEDGRSYISAVSELIYDTSQTCNGTAKVWSSMYNESIGRCDVAMLKAVLVFQFATASFFVDERIRFPH